MAMPLLSGSELLYFGLMNQKPATVSEKQPLVILTTPRLILRATLEADISILHNLIFGDSDVMRFAFSGAPMARDAAEDFMRRFFTFGSSLTGMAVLTERAAGEVIGFARNAPSIHALEKLGMHYLETIADPRRGSRSVYVIEAAAWRRRR
jgi:RimJ/RimL family protein N-acetyltransferase